MVSVAIERINKRARERQAKLKELLVTVDGLTQKQIAEIAEVDESTASRYFNGLINSRKMDAVFNRLYNQYILKSITA